MPHAETPNGSASGEVDRDGPIAIVGMACRFPGDATSPTKFWEMLSKGRAAWSEIPANRYSKDAYSHPNGARAGVHTARGGHFVKGDVGAFDANFFSMSAAEATALDPQVRLLLEVAYESLENAGIPLSHVAGGNASCYVGCSSKDYDALVGADIDDTPLYQAIGSGYSMMANRVSHFFDVHGPSMTLDTACSSSMVALHLGCQSIRNGESCMSIVGSSQLILLPYMAAALSSLSFLSPDSRCYSFDDRANGYARGEGVSVMVLKPLADAIRDGDVVRAVIRGSGTNQDGKTPGITQPSSVAQAALIRSTYAAAGLDYTDTQYFEAHGTGTPVGDPLELGALGETFGGAKRTTGEPLYVGSVKTNIGHLEAGAGLAGLMKTVLAIENAAIPPSLNYKNPNPRLRLDEWNLKVPTDLIPWPTKGQRRASINSFGYGGSNAHCIIDDAYNYFKTHGLQGFTSCVPQAPVLPTDEGYESPGSEASDAEQSKAARLFMISAPESASLPRCTDALVSYLEEQALKGSKKEEQILDRMAYTLASRRTIYSWRTAVTASSVNELIANLKAQKTGKRAAKQPRLLFIFTGQGAQWATMGLGLMRHKVFASSVWKADKYMTSLGADWRVFEELAASAEQSHIAMAKFSQPLCTVLQVALVDLLKFWGVEASAVVGHSSGEIAAAYAIGALSAEDCWKVAYHRGRLSHAVRDIAPQLKGAMMAVGLGETEVLPYLQGLPAGQVAVVACVNSPSSVTLSGDSEALITIEATLKEANVFARRLKVENAYHSPHMQVIANEYRSALSTINPLLPTAAPVMFSSVTGSIILPEQLGADYWVENMVSTVQFHKAVANAFPSGTKRRKGAVDAMIEIGPHSALQGPAKQITTSVGQPSVPYISMLRRDEDGITTALEAIGSLWTMGQSIDAGKVNQLDDEEKKIAPMTDLPSYAWNHTKRYWHESAVMEQYRLRAKPRLDLLGRPSGDSNPLEPRWTNFIRQAELPWVVDHQVEGDILYPAAGMLCAVIEGARQIADVTRTIESFEFRDVLIHRAAVVSPDEGLRLSLYMKPRKIGTRGGDAPWMEFTVYSLTSSGEHSEHCSGLFQTQYHLDVGAGERAAELAADWQTIKNDYDEYQRLCVEDKPPENFYSETLQRRGMYYGPFFQCLTDVKFTDLTACTTIQVQDTKAGMPELYEYEHLLHPVTLDGALQTFGAAVGAVDGSLVPTSIEFIRISADLPKTPGSPFVGFAKAARKGFRNYTGTIAFGDETWTTPYLLLRGYRTTEMLNVEAGAGAASTSSSAIRKLCTELIWKEDVELLQQQDVDLVFAPHKSFDEFCAELSGTSSLHEFLKQLPATSMVAKYLNLQGHKRPDYKLLEIGAGTGSVTAAAVEVLGGRHGSTPRFHQYLVSDANPKQLEATQKKLKDWQSVLTYKPLDINSSIVDQGFEKASFNALIAPNIFCTANNLGPALKNCFELLKPGGKLILTDCSLESQHLKLTDSIDKAWLQVSDRIGGPLMSSAAWLDAVKVAGFADIELTCTSSNAGGYSTMMIASKLAKSSLAFDDVVLLEPSAPSERSQRLSTRLEESLERMGLATSRATLHDAATINEYGKLPISGKPIIALLEAEKPFTWDLTEEDFDAWQTVFLQSSGGLWITRGGLQLDPSGDPAFCATTGLLRTLRTEHPDLRMHELDLSSPVDAGQPEAAALISQVFQKILTDDPVVAETEYAELDGRLFIPRLIDEKHKNHSLQQIGKAAGPEIQPFNQPGRPLKLSIGTPGQLDTLHFVDDTDLTGPLPDDYVEIQIQASAMNFVDIMVSMGLVADTTLGVDAAGVITSVGKAVTLVKPGDRVATCVFGTYCNYMRVPQNLVQKLPDRMSIEEGASLSCVHITSYQCIVEVARLRKGETILIHSAAGGLGQAAIQLAQHIGAEVFVTAGSYDKRKLLQQDYGIPWDHIANSRDTTFAMSIMRMTGGKGVDVVLNSLSGEALRKTWECISAFGRFIEVGKKDIIANTGLEMSPFLRNVTFAGVNVEHMGRQRPDMLAEIFQKVFDLIREGSIGPVHPISVFSYSEIEKAFRVMQQAKHMGKIVLKVMPDDRVPVIPTNPHPLKFKDNATYVLVGGLGGIGRALAQFMASEGCKNLAFVSRSGDSKPEAISTLSELHEKGVRASAYACDIADRASLESTIEKIRIQMPQIKGVIQSAMVLQDYYFEEMSYSQWHKSTRPKIQGTWNLHELMPDDLDFFVMLSSISGICGNGAQSNYAAGNTFLDGLAHYRKARGLAACSLDLGAIMGVGWMAENVKMTAEAQADWARISVQPDELYSLLSSAMTGYADGEANMPTQLVTGAGSGGIGQQMQHLKTSQAFDDPKYSFLRWLDVRGVSQVAEDSTSELKTALSAVTSLSQASELVEVGIAGKLSKALALSVEDIDTSRPVFSYGVDSLLAIELRNWIFKELKAQVSVFDILSKVPMSQLSTKVASKSSFVPASVQRAAAKNGEDKKEDGLVDADGAEPDKVE